MASQDAEAAAAHQEEERMMKSASDFSCQSYEMFVGHQQERSTDDIVNQMKEKMMSLQSVDDVDSNAGGADQRVKVNGRVRKVGTHHSSIRFAIVFFGFNVYSFI